MNLRPMYETGATLPIPVATAGSTTPDWQEAQIALLHIEQRPHRKTLRLMASMRVTLTFVDHDTCTHAKGAVLDTSELIFVEVIGRFTPDAATTVRQIRAASRVPLVVLTDAPRIECTASALAAGADAALALSTVPSVVAARCSALLRRWQYAGTAASRPPAVSDPC